MGKEEKLKNEFVMLSLFASFVHLLSVRLDAAKFGDLFSPIKNLNRASKAFARFEIKEFWMTKITFFCEHY